MQTKNRLLDDVARVAGGALSAMTGVKNEAEDLFRARLERLLASMDLVRREEFEVVKEMAARARSEQEKLAVRLAALEAKAGKAVPKKSSPKKSVARSKAKKA